MEARATVEQLRNGFSNNKNFSYAQRMHNLRILEDCLADFEAAYIDALAADFDKPAFESFLTEIFTLGDELRFVQKRLKSWMKPQKVRTPVQLLPASSRIYHEPKGTVLIIGAWNYPIYLTLAPLIGALAAGNTVLLKPSELAPHASAILLKSIQSRFPADVVQVLEGDGAFTDALLDLKFDHILYTGSTKVGQLIYLKAAEHLCPVTLELGGKSPAVFHRSANLSKGVKRLLWGKFVNGGQTCVAPDYALVPASLKKEFLEACGTQLELFFKDNDQQSQIINSRHFERILELLQGNHTVHFGGQNNASQRWIAPTIVELSDLGHPLMQEEIFGPVLPVYFYGDEAEIQSVIARNPNPLALYIFSTDREFSEKILRENPSGGAVLNDVMMHLSNAHLPFGGRGTSGFGNYHGIHGFHTFSHAKSVLRQVNWIDPAFRYQPYTEKKFRFLRKLTSFLKAF